MNQKTFKALRTQYRAAKRKDAKWRPDPYAARNVIQHRPDTAEALLRQLEPRIAEVVAARPEAPVMPVSPRVSAYCAWRPGQGKYANLNLSMRVAMRQARRAIRAYEAGRMLSPGAASIMGEVDALYAAGDRLDATGLRMQFDAEYAFRRAMHDLGARAIGGAW